MPSFWNDMDPSGSNFLGLGDKTGRTLAALMTANTSEFHRPDPFNSAQGTALNKWGRSVGGSGPGAVGGFITGGWPGAVAGGIGGGIAAGSGATDNTTMKGWGENFGIGLGSGAAAGYGAGSGLFAGGSGAGGAAGGATSGMTSYMPTSTPVMANAGSTLGGGMSSPLNYGGAVSGSSIGIGGGSASPSVISQIMKYQRMMPQGGQGSAAPAASQANLLSKLYQMFPSLRPGSQMGQQASVGGTNGF